MRVSTTGILLLLGVLFAGGPAACEKKPRDESPVLLRVNGRVVTMEQFQRSFERSLPADQDLSAEEKRDLERSYLRQVLDRELALAEAERLGLSVTQGEVEEMMAEYRHDYPDKAFDQMLRDQGIDEVQWRRELKERLLMEKVIRQEVYTGITVGEEETADYYREHRSDFDRPEQVRARQIVVATEAEGQRILGLLRQGEPFAEMARRHSLSPDSEQGGDLGFFARGQMPQEFDTVVFSLPVGRLSDLVRSEYGFHIFLVEERRTAQRLSLEQVKEEVVERLRNEKEELAYQEWLQMLGGRANLEVNWSLM